MLPNYQSSSTDPLPNRLLVYSPAFTELRHRGSHEVLGHGLGMLSFGQAALVLPRDSYRWPEAATGSAAE
ncbi:hypothetical protein GCM10028814_30480 [Angustibacter aerolatus]